MYDYSKTRLTDYLVNLTGSPVSTYQDSTGTIKTYHPAEQILPPYVEQEQNSPIFHYVVTEKMLAIAKRIGRELTDLVTVSDTSEGGRHGVSISHFIWAENPNTRVAVYPRAYETPIPHL